MFTVAALPDPLFRCRCLSLALESLGRVLDHARSNVYMFHTGVRGCQLGSRLVVSRVSKTTNPAIDIPWKAQKRKS